MALISDPVYLVMMNFDKFVNKSDISIMLPYKTMLHIDKESRVPIYIQISNEFIKNISSGRIKAGMKLPGTRHLSEILKVNRRTVITAFDELSAQGWITIKPNKGPSPNNEAILIPMMSCKAI